VNSAYSTTTAQLAATVSGLACGSAYVFQVDAFDLEGNSSTRASVTASTAACADTQAPSAPLNVASTSRTATSIALAWSASTDNVGVTGYGLYRAGSQVGTTSTTNAIFSGLACNTNYTLAVDAYDAAGNRSSKTTVMVATTACPDTTPPSTPTGLAASNVTQTGLTLTWNASSDNVGVTGYDVYRNGTKMTTVSSTSSSQTGLACGTSYTLGVVARDAAGNSSSQASLQATTSVCSAPPPPPSSGAPYLDANFANGNFDPSMVTVFESYTVDPRLATWGGLSAVEYDANGMTHDPNQRVTLVAPPVPLRGQSWVSRQEVRQTDGPWGTDGNAVLYDKSTIRSDTTTTLGGAFSPGMVRWFAYDYLLPLNLNGDTFNFVTNNHQTLMDCHETTSTSYQTWNVLDLGTVRNDNGRELGAEIQSTGNTGPSGIGDYRRINYLRLTDPSGNRTTSAYNVWHQLVVGVKFSDQGVVGNSPGWLEIWNDGVNVMPRESRPTSLPGSGGCWLQAQMYKTHGVDLVGGANSTVVYFGGFRAGLTKADVER
jgi:chitodextrinase